MSFPPEYTAIFNAIANDMSVCDGMAAVIDDLASQYVHDDWDKFCQLPFEIELDELDSWFTDLLNDEPPPRTVRGLWFGIFNPYVDRETLAAFYVAGSTRFKKHDPDFAWAHGPDYFPEGRYAPFRIMAGIRRLAYQHENGLGNDAEQFCCLAYVALIAKRLLSNSTAQNAFSFDNGDLGVAIGWDSGDALYIGMFGPNGFDPTPVSEAATEMENAHNAIEQRLKTIDEPLTSNEQTALIKNVSDRLQNDDPFGAISVASERCGIETMPNEVIASLATYCESLPETSTQKLPLKQWLALVAGGRRRENAR